MDLRVVRRKKDITQIELSKLTGIQTSKISLIENGHVAPTMDEIRAFKKIFNDAIDWGESLTRKAIKH